MSDPEPLSDQPFSYQQTKNGKVFIFWYDKQAKILSGESAAKFITEIESLDDAGAQLLMARLTGNFKRGNERQAKSKRDR
ncbi:MAG: hypothetical protein U0528_10845 [Anaerolineae bacterium]|nr:hypothetical protein [Anaerolineae bacterium]